MKTFFHLLKKNPLSSSLGLILLLLSAAAQADSGISTLAAYAGFIFGAQFLIGLGAFAFQRYQLMAFAFAACWLLGYGLQQQQDVWTLVAKQETQVTDTFSVAYIDLDGRRPAQDLASALQQQQPDVLLLKSYKLNANVQLDKALQDLYAYGSQTENNLALFSKNALFEQERQGDKLVEVHYPGQRFSVELTDDRFLLQQNPNWAAQVGLNAPKRLKRLEKGLLHTPAFHCVEWRPYTFKIRDAYIGFFQIQHDSLSQTTASKL